MSLRASAPIPDACSGLKYPGVPNTMPACVSGSLPDGASSPIIFARPKSSSLTTSPVPPPSTSMTFAGLMSRCTMPSECAWRSAEATPRAITTASAGATGGRAKRSASGSPRTNSITR